MNTTLVLRQSAGRTLVIAQYNNLKQLLDILLSSISFRITKSDARNQPIKADCRDASH